MEQGVLQQGRASFSIDLHPAYSIDPLEGIRQLLDPRLLRWDDELNGVLLGYKDIKRLPAQAAIRPYFPYIHLKIQADVLVFKPRTGSIICGHVTKLGADFIGMTVLGAINAAVGRQHIRPDLRYSREEDAWKDGSNEEATICVGSAVTFAVEGLCIEKSGICAIMGSLAEPWAGSCRTAAHGQPAAFPDPQRWQTYQQMNNFHAAAQDFPLGMSPQQLASTEPAAASQHTKPSVKVDSTSKTLEKPGDSKMKAKRKAAETEEPDPAQSAVIEKEAAAPLSGVRKKKRKVSEADGTPAPSLAPVEPQPVVEPAAGSTKKGKKKKALDKELAANGGTPSLKASHTPAKENLGLMEGGSQMDLLAKEGQTRQQPNEHGQENMNGLGTMRQQPAQKQVQTKEERRERKRLKKLLKLEAQASTPSKPTPSKVAAHSEGSSLGNEGRVSLAQAGSEHRTADKTKKKKKKSRLSNVPV